ncbi:MAG TPA: outer membrane beta-barrel protein [Bacteroidota bacterium]|nr:outer membrane beta-barrel protein [Bacteroidota bacterium]
MRTVVILVLLALCCSMPLLAQQDKPTDQRTTIVVQNEQPPKDTFYSIRVGAWFPEGWEDWDKVESTGDAKEEIDQSQALGIDFHFRKNVGHPIYVDVALAGWYTSYKSKLTDVSRETVKNTDAWVVVIPLTLGISVAPLPDNPFQPYAMAGAGLYTGITGRDRRVSETNEPVTETYFQFGWFGGVGVDFLFSPNFGISVAAKYQAIEFEFDKVDYTQQENFTGVQVMAGVVMRI